MKKRCSKCSETKELINFHKKSSNSDGRRSTCKACRAAPPKEWASGYRTCGSWEEKKPNSEFTLVRGSPRRYCKACRHRYVQYGLNKRQIQSMWELQKGLCSICDNLLGESFAVDHDHNCCPTSKTCGTCVRGLLCHMCNTRLGWYEKFSERAERYLRGENDD